MQFFNGLKNWKFIARNDTLIDECLLFAKMKQMKQQNWRKCEERAKKIEAKRCKKPLKVKKVKYN